VVYTNRERAIRDADARNEALALIGRELDEWGEKGKNWSEKRLRDKAELIVKPYTKHIEWRISRKDGPRIRWSYSKSGLREVEHLDGKWLILATDETLDAKEIVNTYLEKDFIEKVFRTVKTHEEIEPVRHRLDRRVRAYVFVCVLAYRLLSVLQWRLKEASGREDSWERADDLLRGLGRVERADVKFGNEVKTMYLNVTKEIRDTLKGLGTENLLEEETRLDM
jgi:transposase